MTRRLQSFGHVQGLVFGAWGEASPDVERLLSALCHSGAERRWQSMRSASPAEAKGIVAWMLRVCWGMTALQEAVLRRIQRPS